MMDHSKIKIGDIYWLEDKMFVVKVQIAQNGN